MIKQWFRKDFERSGRGLC